MTLHLLCALALCMLAPAARASTLVALDVPALTRPTALNWSTVTKLLELADR